MVVDARSQPLNPTEFASAVTAISSAFGDQTRRDVFLHVHGQAEGVTATEVAEHFNLHANVARHHLDKLAAGGYVAVVTERARGGGAGRPSKRYRATSAALVPALPIRHDVVLINLLKRALLLLPRAQAEAMAEEVGAEYGLAMARQMGDVGESQHSFRAALHMVADAMTAHGFDARVEDPNPRNGGLEDLRIVAEHCPFGGAEVVHPVLCAVDRGMVSGMMKALYGDSASRQTSSRQTSSLLDGGDSCITAVDFIQPVNPLASAPETQQFVHGA